MAAVDGTLSVSVAVVADNFDLASDTRRAGVGATVVVVAVVDVVAIEVVVAVVACVACGFFVVEDADVVAAMLFVEEAAAAAAADASALVLFEPELLRRAASCELDDSESELDELLSDPLELPLDDDEPELEPELDSVVLVDWKTKTTKNVYKHI